MHYVGESYWGMHFFWWLFWVLAIMLLFSPITPISTGRRRQTPLEILQRRYAAGEVSTTEYEERKAKLDRDAKPVK
jgi:putative membrane protein